MLFFVLRGNINLYLNLRCICLEKRWKYIRDIKNSDRIGYKVGWIGDEE